MTEYLNAFNFSSISLFTNTVTTACFYHRIVGVRRDLERSSGPSPLLAVVSEPTREESSYMPTFFG